MSSSKEVHLLYVHNASVTYFSHMNSTPPEGEQLLTINPSLCINHLRKLNNIEHSFGSHVQERNFQEKAKGQPEKQILHENAQEFRNSGVLK